MLTASVRDVRFFASLLRGVHFSNMATIGLAKSGLTVTVEEARSIHGKAFIFAPLFDEYETHAEGVDDDDDENEFATFQIHLNVLIECLNIFGTAGPISAPITGNANNNFKRWKRNEEDGGSDHEGVGEGDGRGRGRGLAAYFAGSEKSTSMRMSYAGDGYPLTLMIAEDASGPTTTCEISTYDPEPHLDFNLNFGNSDVLMRVILKMDYPNDPEVLETFECERPISCTYRFSHLSRTLRALSSSTKTSVRIDEDGLLSLQFQMFKPGTSAEGFIEFRCLPLDD
ncbi:hypothetical protein MD484_g2820, partial [Candolleomyces efflorescens]